MAFSENNERIRRKWKHQAALFLYKYAAWEIILVCSSGIKADRIKEKKHHKEALFNRWFSDIERL